MFSWHRIKRSVSSTEKLGTIGFFMVLNANSKKKEKKLNKKGWFWLVQSWCISFFARKNLSQIGLRS